MYIYICIYIYIHICIRVYIHTYMYVYIHIHIYTLYTYRSSMSSWGYIALYIHIYTYIYMCKYTHTYKDMYIYTKMCIYIFTTIHLHIKIYICTDQECLGGARADGGRATQDPTSQHSTKAPHKTKACRHTAQHSFSDIKNVCFIWCPL